MKYGGKSLETAAAVAIEELRVHGGEGGLIAVDDRGNGAVQHRVLRRPQLTNLVSLSHHAIELLWNVPWSHSEGWNATGGYLPRRSLGMRKGACPCIGFRPIPLPGRHNNLITPVSPRDLASQRIPYSGARLPIRYMEDSKDTASNSSP